MIAVDEDGSIANGDVVMAVIARHWKSIGKLRNDTVVTTVMSNLGFRKALVESGITLVQTKVGDRYVLEGMRQHKAVLGGEQSGHVIFLDRGRSGDGLLTGIRLLEVMAGTGRELRDLRKEAMAEYPQVLLNIRVADRHGLEGCAPVWDAVGAAERELGDDGRVLVRASGTEPLVRVMVEASSEDAAHRYADRIAAIVTAELGEEVTGN
jgi:phosphoglucosamine mutase